MDLKEFVTDALVQISAGITEAQNSVKKGTIAPALYSQKAETYGRVGMIPATNGRMATLVQFDVAVTVSSEVSGGGGAKISIPFFEVSGEGGGNKSSTNVSRISFAVPIAYPVEEIEYEEPAIVGKSG